MVNDLVTDRPWFERIGQCKPFLLLHQPCLSVTRRPVISSEGEIVIEISIAGKAHSVILQNLIAFSGDEDYYRQRTADPIPLLLSNSIPLTEAMIVTTVVKSLVILYCLFIVLAVHPATASTTPPATQEVMQGAWVPYATDEDGAAYAFNPSNVERLQGNLVRVWVKALYTEKNKKYKEGQFQWEIDCAKKMMRGLAATVKKKDGTSEAISQSSDWSTIPAESTAETLYETMCTTSKDKKK
jgi:hypothetical protein